MNISTNVFRQCQNSTDFSKKNIKFRLEAIKITSLITYVITQTGSFQPMRCLKKLQLVRTNCKPLH